MEVIEPQGGAKLDPMGLINCVENEMLLHTKYIYMVSEKIFKFPRSLIDRIYVGD